MNRITAILFAISITLLSSCGGKKYVNDYVSSNDPTGAFTLFDKESLTALATHPEDHQGVSIALENFRNDLAGVSGREIPSTVTEIPREGTVVIAGTLGKSPWIDDLAERGLIPAAELKGKWEKFIITAIETPFPGISSALVIAGSDKRGTIYGIYDLSEKIGVSPWYYWADVPVQQRDELHVLPGIHTDGEPKVRYRGIFINDEAPALAGWVHENFGDFNHEFYEHVFELILRLKGNYLWPAMWGRAFYDDDTLNPVRADAHGVVIGTSHHEPLMRAHAEWSRYGEGPWNYEENPEILREFWRTGIERMGDHESIVTIGMRGDGDEPMTEGTAIALLERIVKDQRKIIEEVTGKPAHETPQAWALYKEVQAYYDNGMRVPGDVLLLLCDDNWGNIRKLPKPEDRDREGGFGIYYHFDYVGGPRNYKWLNTNQIERTWDQMHLAYEYGADRLWIVNVGDIKPMEFPISFFLDYAWDPEAIGADDLPGYYSNWAEAQFGPGNAEEIGYILAKYTKYNARRKPEMLAPDTYSLINFRESERVVKKYDALAKRAERIYSEIDPVYRDAFFQLVLFPVRACANLNALYRVTALNHLYAKQGRSLTNVMADSVKVLFERDAEMTRQYHEELSGGKWNHMMSQTHIGYTYWQEPPFNKMPEVKNIDIPDEAALGIVAEGHRYGDSISGHTLPVFDRYNDQVFRIEVYNKGDEPFEFRAASEDNWVKLSKDHGNVRHQDTIVVSVDWSLLEESVNSSVINISGAGQTEQVQVIADNTLYLKEIEKPVFMEDNNVVSMHAENYSEAVESNGVRWEFIPNLGRTAGAMTSFPVNSNVQSPGGNSPHLVYPVYLKDTGTINILTYLSPTLNFHNSDGRRIAVSIDDQQPVVINIHGENPGWMWNWWVGSNIIYTRSEHQVDSPGLHEIKYWLVDPGLVLQNLVAYTGEAKRSYLGPPQSFYNKIKHGS
ncbi:MAG: glycosyl hydrolase 115 family protein [Bacteroidales bacterium]|nr:glycosyl hydrolase 115 family protein [Bacteroidales bacterium]